MDKKQAISTERKTTFCCAQIRMCMTEIAQTISKWCNGEFKQVHRIGVSNMWLKVSKIQIEWNEMQNGVSEYWIENSLKLVFEISLHAGKALFFFFLMWFF